MRRRLASIVILLSIVAYGIFRILLCRFYSEPVSWFLHAIGIEPKQLLDTWNTFDTSAYYDHILGFIIYYPTYLGLHLLFIYVLFYHQPKTKIWLMTGLTVLVAGLLGTVFLSKLQGWSHLFTIAYKLFRQLFGLPFILLSIEGGRILLNDLKRLQKEE